MGIFPQNDTFQEFSTAYGERLASYVRHIPWLTSGDTGSGYSIGNSRSTMHDGYSNAYRLASFRSDTESGQTPSLGAVLWRQAYLLNARASVTFLCITVSGSPSYTDFRYAGVCVRVSGGTYDDTDPTAGQFVKDTSGYWLVLTKETALAPLFLLMRVNGGVVTLLSSFDGLAATQNAMSGAHEMSLGVANGTGNVVLTAFYDQASIFTYTDSSGSRLSSAGRCGFGLCRERRNIGGTTGKNLATVASRFTVSDTTLNQNVLADDFKRVNIDCNPSTSDSIGTAGKVLMSMWTLDIHGPTGWVSGSTQYRDPGQNRVDARGGIYNFSQIAASDPITQSRSCTFRKNSVETELVATGILLRGAFNSSGGVTSGYLLTLNYVSATTTAILRRFTGGTTTTLATADVSTGYGLSTSGEYELLASVQSSAGDKGPPLLVLRINGLAVIGWTSLVSGVTTNFSQIIDTTSSAVLQGSAQGLHLIPPDPGGGQIYYRLWTNEAIPPGTTVDEENEPSIVIASECAGKVGALTVPLGSTFEVESSHRIVEQGYETGHVARVMFDRNQRRRWRVSLPAATGTERDDLWAFWSAHGKAVPFDFTDPEDGETICAHFAEDGLSTLKVAPLVTSYSFVVEELFDTDTTTTVAVGPRRLTITGQRPQIMPLKVGVRAVATIRHNALVTTVLRPGNAALVLTGQVPTI